MPTPRKPEAELEDVVVREVSAVPAGANGKVFAIVKRDGAAAAVPLESDGNGGLRTPAAKTDAPPATEDAAAKSEPAPDEDKKPADGEKPAEAAKAEMDGSKATAENYPDYETCVVGLVNAGMPNAEAESRCRAVHKAAADDGAAAVTLTTSGDPAGGAAVEPDAAKSAPEDVAKEGRVMSSRNLAAMKEMLKQGQAFVKSLGEFIASMEKATAKALGDEDPSVVTPGSVALPPGPSSAEAAKPGLVNQPAPGEPTPEVKALAKRMDDQAAVIAQQAEIIKRQGESLLAIHKARGESNVLPPSAPAPEVVQKAKPVDFPLVIRHDPHEVERIRSESRAQRRRK